VRPLSALLDFGQRKNLKTVRMWDVRTGKEQRRFTGHSEAVTSIALSADGRRAVSGSLDKTVCVWDLPR
jgi:WD40 repeat protein